MTVSLLSARWIVTGTTTENVPDIHKHAALAHEDGVILAIGSLEDMRRDYPGAPETAYPHHLILPGLVNSHHHIGLTPCSWALRTTPWNCGLPRGFPYGALIRISIRSTLHLR